MVDLRVTYAGLNLKSPLIAGSSGLNKDSETVKALEQAGIGAIVLPSLFEEEIEREIEHLETDSAYTEGLEMLQYFQKEHALENYLDLVKRIKAAVQIPVIASVNCYKGGSWMEFAHRIAAAGADALEVNIFFLTSDPEITSEEITGNYLSIARQMVKEVDIPVILKVGSSFDNVARTLRELSFTGIDGLVLFNRFVNPDIDINSITMRAADVMNHPGDLSVPLRWIGIMNGKTDCDLCSSTGVKNGEDLVKMLLAGANAVQMVSAIYHRGVAVVTETLSFLESWMEKHNFSTIEEFQGRISQESLLDPSLYERAQFIKYFSENKNKI